MRHLIEALLQTGKCIYSLLTLSSSRYNVDTGHRQGFTARPVIGGLYARMLTSKTH